MPCSEGHTDLDPPALLAAEADEFLAVAVPFLRDALGAGDAALAVASERNLGLLRAALGDDAGRVALRPAGDLRTVRRFVAAQAADAGMTAERVDDMVYAAHEVAANAHVHGGGSATLRTWSAGGEFLCEVADGGEGMCDPQAGHAPPSTAQIGGRGLWLARQLCDFVQVRTGAAGTVVRLHVTL